MTKAELEDLIKLHNETVEEHINKLFNEWRSLRWDQSNHQRIRELKAEMDRLKTERVELKETA